MRRLCGYLILSIWPALMIAGWVFDPCGGGLYEDIACKAPEKPRVHVNLGLQYRNRGRIDLAQQEFERAIDASLLNCELDCLGQNVPAVAASNLAAIYLDYGGPELWQKADRVLEHARNTYPPSELVLANSIEVMIRFGELERAEAFAEAALKEVPRSAVLYSQLADVYAVTGRCDRQREALATMNALNPLVEVDHVFTHRNCTEGF